MRRKLPSSIIASMFIVLACVLDPKAKAAMTPLGWVCLAAVELVLASIGRACGAGEGRIRNLVESEGANSIA